VVFALALLIAPKELNVYSFVNSLLTLLSQRRGATVKRFAPTERHSERELGNYKHLAPPELKKRTDDLKTKTKLQKLKTKGQRPKL